jgi:hypothetical protein
MCLDLLHHRHVFAVMQFLYLAGIFNTHAVISPEFPCRNAIKEEFVETTSDRVV